MVPSYCTKLDTLMPATQPVLKVIGANGQISLGKQFAGRQVLVEEQEPGVWLVRTATVIPDNERWLLQPATAHAIEEALNWAMENPADPAASVTLLQQWRQNESN